MGGARPLEGLSIGITADRRADEQAELLTRRGARVLHGPTIRTLPLGPDERTRFVTEELIDRPPDVMIANTGVGVRGWMAMAESWGLGDRLLEVLTQAQLVSRGPKAAGALLTAGLQIDWHAPSERLDEVVTHLVEGGIAGRRVALQLSGDDHGRAAQQLEDAGAEVLEIPVYRWVLPDDTGPAVRLIEAACAGRLDAVTFTAAPAVRNLFALAEAEGLIDELCRVLNGPVLPMCVGPVCLEAASSHGVVAARQPPRPRLGAMVQALTGELEQRRRSLTVGSHEVVLQGSLVRVNGQAVRLADRERDVFELLSRRPGAVVAKRTLLAGVWGAAHGDAHVLEVTVARLRRRLAPTGLAIETVIRRGYRLKTT